MKVLFVHQNFPGQFRHVAALLGARPGHEVVAVGSGTARALPGVRLIRYDLPASGPQGVHPFARRFDVECRRAEQVLYAGTELLAAGFAPDLVVVHCGWGEALPLRALFPDARIVTYVEYFYRARGADSDFDAEWPALSLDGEVELRGRNAATLLSLAEADVAVSPTAWQRSLFPPRLQPLIRVCHEGVDLDAVRPDRAADFRLPDGSVVRAGDEVVTYVSRDLEPLRGYHVLMRALPRILRERPRARVLVVGGDGVSYGSPPEDGRSWKEVFWAENRDRLDAGRVHFLGRLDYGDYLKVLQVSAVHLYLTYPFVLSWSMLEAMAAGCLLVASATPPVEEVIDGTNGLLVGFFDVDGLADRVVGALSDPGRFSDLRRRARDTVAQRYERGACLARFLDLAAGSAPSPVEGE